MQTKVRVRSANLARLALARKKIKALVVPLVSQGCFPKVPPPIAVSAQGARTQESLDRVLAPLVIPELSLGKLRFLSGQTPKLIAYALWVQWRDKMGSVGNVVKALNALAATQSQCQCQVSMQMCVVSFPKKPFSAWKEITQSSSVGQMRRGVIPLGSVCAATDVDLGLVS